MEENERKNFVTTYQCMIGWKAVLLTWNKEMQNYEPWNTGYFAFDKEEEAIEEAKKWAEAEEIEYIARVKGE
jgi:hypothetical protein